MLNKVMEKIVCPLIVEDMRSSLDKSQYANQPGLSTQHYLIKLIDRILTFTDKSSKGECVAVLATMMDWKKAFPMLDHTLGVKSFVRNGVRASLIPKLATFFERRSMRVAWRGKLSSERPLSGSGPQGSSWGILEYLSQSNNSADCVPEADRAKFMDDLTILEVIVLANVGLASYNIRANIPTNIATHNQFIPSEHLKTQEYLKTIDNWTEENLMNLNEKKTINMVFNFTKDCQFTTGISLKNEKLETTDKTELFGTIITSDLKWHDNTKYIVKKANQKMRLLHKFSKFTRNKAHLIYIFKSQVRGNLEYCSTVWHSGLTEPDTKDIERIQKAAVRIFMRNKYQGYEEALKFLKLDSLKERRIKMALNFAKRSLKLEHFSKLLPKNGSKHMMSMRNPERFVVNSSNTERHRRSAVPFLQRLLNQDYSRQKRDLPKLLQAVVGGWYLCHEAGAY